MRFRRETAMSRLTPRLVAAACGVIGMAGAAAATEVKYPTSDPRIVLQVPDGWIVSTDANGLDLVSPEKNARVLVGIVVGNTKATDAWARAAHAKLAAAGTRFDEHKPSRTLRSSGKKPLVNTPSSSAGFGFTGAPSLKGNFGTPAEQGFPSSPESKPQPQPETQPDLKPIEVVQTTGSTLAGKPVDEELYLFKAGSGDVVLLEQQSGPTDERGVVIERSLKILK